MCALFSLIVFSPLVRRPRGIQGGRSAYGGGRHPRRRRTKKWPPPLLRVCPSSPSGSATGSGPTTMRTSLSSSTPASGTGVRLIYTEALIGGPQHRIWISRNAHIPCHRFGNSYVDFKMVPCRMFSFSERPLIPKIVSAL